MTETIGPSAKVIADSISPKGNRLLTMELTMHRFVLSEFNTHRAFSRNSASSRAIPIEKQIERVMNNPAIPVEFGANKTGMQAGDLLKGDELSHAKIEWLTARNYAATSAQKLADLGVHKQVTNRILEPFMWHTVIVSSTEWDGFYKQRCSALAQPEIHVVADLMLEAHIKSVPSLLNYGEWHTPYIQPDEDFDILTMRAISAARCARVSHLTHDGVRDPEKDIGLFKFLTEQDPPHASPLEHVATPDFTPSMGNFVGWKQLRHEYWPDF